MARNAAVAITNNFSGGLNTESSPLNFPENSCTDTFDCVFDVNGVSRRLGIDLETAYIEKTIDRSSAVVNNYVWKNVAGDGNLSLLVVQAGNFLHFYDIRNPDRLSSGEIATTIDLTDYSPSGAPEPYSNECQFATGNGLLFVAHPHLESFYVDYDEGNFTATQITLEIRDFEGLDDGYAVDFRPTTSMGSVTVAHHYNLLNQGWTSTNLTAWDTARSDLPSNADVMWSFKNSSDAFDTTTIANGYRGNSPAPKGHYILNIYSQQRDTVSGLVITDVTTSYQRSSTLAFFAGRIFYSGINYKGFNSKILFSQIIEKNAQIGRCYQVNDPTSEDAFDLLPSDGGVITIPEAGTIFKLFSVQGGLLVFASNGVWRITGSTGIGFAANDYTVLKISSTQTLSASTFVDLGGYPVWWNAEGIYVYNPSAGEGPAQIKSISDDKIKTFFQDIPLSSRLSAKGAYNAVEGEIRWIYRSSEKQNIKQQYEFDRILIFDTSLGAFYPWSIDTTTVKLNSIFVVEGAGGTVTEEAVVASGDPVVADGDPVVVFITQGGTITPKFKYLVSTGNVPSEAFSFAEDTDDNYVDWASKDETDFTSYFISGYRIRGNAQLKTQLNYLYLFSNNEIDNKFYVQGRWNFANTGNSGKWSSKQLISNTDSNFSTEYKRVKIRGQGVALQIYVESFSGQPFDIIGWSAYETGNQKP